jgi:hypothetical protein
VSDSLPLDRHEKEQNSKKYRERESESERERKRERESGREKGERESHVATLLIISHTFHYSQCSHSLLRLNQLFWFTLPTQQGSRGM